MFDCQDIISRVNANDSALESFEEVLEWYAETLIALIDLIVNEYYACKKPMKFDSCKAMVRNFAIEYDEMKQTTTLNCTELFESLDRNFIRMIISAILLSHFFEHGCLANLNYIAESFRLPADTSLLEDYLYSVVDVINSLIAYCTIAALYDDYDMPVIVEKFVRIVNRSMIGLNLTPTENEEFENCITGLEENIEDFGDLLYDLKAEDLLELSKMADHRKYTNLKIAYTCSFN